MDGCLNSLLIQMLLKFIPIPSHPNGVNMKDMTCVVPRTWSQEITALQEVTVLSGVTVWLLSIAPGAVISLARSLPASPPTGSCIP